MKNIYLMSFLIICTLFLNAPITASADDSVIIEASSDKIVAGNSVLVQWSAPDSAVCEINGQPVFSRPYPPSRDYLIETVDVSKTYELKCTINGKIFTDSVKVQVRKDNKNVPTLNLTLENVHSFGNKTSSADLVWTSTGVESCLMYIFFTNNTTVNFLDGFGDQPTNGTMPILGNYKTRNTYFITCTNKQGVDASKFVSF